MDTMKIKEAVINGWVSRSIYNKALVGVNDWSDGADKKLLNWVLANWEQVKFKYDERDEVDFLVLK